MKYWITSEHSLTVKWTCDSLNLITFDNKNMKCIKNKSKSRSNYQFCLSNVKKELNNRSINIRVYIYTHFEIKDAESMRIWYTLSHLLICCGGGGGGVTMSMNKERITPLSITLIHHSPILQRAKQIIIKIITQLTQIDHHISTFSITAPRTLMRKQSSKRI